mgnify:FL=1
MQTIRTLREAAGLSQRELAQLLNVSQQSIYKYETGQVLPSIAFLRDISTFFHTTVDYLLSADDVPPSLAIPQCELTLDEFHLLHHYRMMPSYQKRTIRKMMEKIVKSSDFH